MSKKSEKAEAALAENLTEIVESAAAGHRSKAIFLPAGGDPEVAQKIVDPFEPPATEPVLEGTENVPQGTDAAATAPAEVEMAEVNLGTAGIIARPAAYLKRTWQGLDALGKERMHPELFNALIAYELEVEHVANWRADGDTLVIITKGGKKIRWPGPIVPLTEADKDGAVLPERHQGALHERTFRGKP